MGEESRTYSASGSSKIDLHVSESGSATDSPHNKSSKQLGDVSVLPAHDDEHQHAAVLPAGMDKEAFTGFTAFGLAFSVINSWVVLVVGLGSGLVSGGPSALVWGFLYASICNMATVLSHGEILAVFPTAGGQYHWAAILSPSKVKAFISWLTGMLNVIGLWLGATTAGFLSTNLLTSVILVNSPDYEPTPAKAYGIFVAIVVCGPLVTLLLGTRGNRLLDQGLMVISVLCALAIVITLPATAPVRAPASFVFGGLNNMTGWDSMAIAWLLGLLQSAFAFLGFDLIYHIAEEMPNPKREAPAAVNWLIGVSAVSGMAVLLAMLFSIGDLETVIGTPYGLPFAQICLDSTGSRAATTIFVLIPAILFINSVRGITITVSRVLMAMGRDHVLPYSHMWSKTLSGEPIVGVTVSIFVSLICGLVQLGSAAAFNSLLGGATAVFEISYAIPAALMLCGGRAKLNRMAPNRTSNLGRWGPVCNMITVFFVVQSVVIYCFPSVMPVTPDNMSYVVVYLGGFGFILAGVWFLYARKSYEVPSMETIIRLVDRDAE